MSKGKYNVYNDTQWACCPCGWSWEGADNGRGGKDKMKRLHAKKCEVMSYLLDHPELIQEDVASYAGDGGGEEGRVVLGGVGVSAADLHARANALSDEGEVLPTKADIEAAKKAKKNAKRRARAKKKKAEKKSGGGGGGPYERSYTEEEQEDYAKKHPADHSHFCLYGCGRLIWDDGSDDQDTCFTCLHWETNSGRYC